MKNTIIDKALQDNEKDFVEMLEEENNLYIQLYEDQITVLKEKIRLIEERIELYKERQMLISKMVTNVKRTPSLDNHGMTRKYIQTDELDRILSNIKPGKRTEDLSEL